MLTTLRQRLFVFVLIPVALLLLAGGFTAFYYARNTMIKQWREGSNLKLQWAAHQIDMRLELPKEWMALFHQTGGMGQQHIQTWLLAQIKKAKGVESVSLELSGSQGGGSMMQDDSSMMGEGSSMMGGGRGGSGGRGAGGAGEEMGQMRFHRGRIAQVTSPQFNPQTGKKTVTLVSDLLNEQGRQVGTLKVVMRFDYIIENVLSYSRWHGDRACLVDESGLYLDCAGPAEEHGKALGDTGSSLEKAVLTAMKKEPHGTIMGEGRPPKEVGGFYRLEEAPWTIVVFAPGAKILAPIITFRNYFFLFGIVCILLILLLIRFTAGKTVRAIREISQAAQRVAAGDYGKPLPIPGRDEIGQLTGSFNTMVEGLKQRDFIRNTFGRYVDKEIAEELVQRPETARLGGEKREVAILMSDLRGFTPLCETLSPEAVIKIVNRYFSLMIEIIQEHRGIIVDFFGDAVLVFFDPLEKPVVPKVRQAVRCALKMQEAMKQFNTGGTNPAAPELQMGIGVNAGEVVVGNIGSEARAKYGIVGAAVNMTQRIQSAAGEGEVVISSSVHRHIQQDVTVRRTFETTLKGVQDPVTLHVVEGLSARN